ncbi:MAG: ferredoxin [Acidimicrobiales bacterium]
MRVRVDTARCQGHGRCYALAPDLFAPDELGDGHEVGRGTVAPGVEQQATLAVANCPEQAIAIEKAT